jgi:hypothetical protein
MRTSYPAIVASLALLGGCSASEVVQQPLGASSSMLRPAAQTIQLKPSSLKFGVEPSHTRAVAISGGTAPYSLVQSNAEIAAVSNPQRTGKAWGFDVANVASGTTIVTVRDSSGATTALSVNQQACTAPRPQFVQIYPQPGATNVSLNPGFVYVAEPAGDPSRPQAHNFYARLIGSDGSVVSGGDFRATKEAPPAASAPPPPSSILMRAGVTKLRSGITYRLLYPTTRQPCIAPFSTGSFST